MCLLGWEDWHNQAHLKLQWQRVGVEPQKLFINNWSNGGLPLKLEGNSIDVATYLEKFSATFRGKKHQDSGRYFAKLRMQMMNSKSLLCCSHYALFFSHRVQYRLVIVFCFLWRMFVASEKKKIERYFTSKGWYVTLQGTRIRSWRQLSSISRGNMSEFWLQTNSIIHS